MKLLSIPVNATPDTIKKKKTLVIHVQIKCIISKTLYEAVRQVYYFMYKKVIPIYKLTQFNSLTSNTTLNYNAGNTFITINL